MGLIKNYSHVHVDRDITYRVTQLKGPDFKLRTDLVDCFQIFMQHLADTRILLLKFQLNNISYAVWYEHPDFQSLLTPTFTVAYSHNDFTKIIAVEIHQTKMYTIALRDAKQFIKTKFWSSYFESAAENDVAIQSGWEWGRSYKSAQLMFEWIFFAKLLT